MEKVKVSVVIPVYNTEKYVEDTLNSIRNQTLRELEIIVINDGSTDGSLEVVESVALRDKRIKVYSQQNKGVSETRNRGIKEASGVFIYFMDSDDLLAPDALKACFEKCKSQKLDFVFFDAEPFGMKNINIDIHYKRTHKLKNEVYKGDEVLELLLERGGYLASPCLNFIHIGFLQKIHLLFYPGHIHEDELFTFILYLRASRVGFLAYPFFKRRFRADSITTKKFSRSNLQGYFEVARQLILFKEEMNDPRAEKLIDLRLKEIFYGVLYNTRSMELSDRNYVLRRCIHNFRRYIKMKDLALAYFPISRLLK